MFVKIEKIFRGADGEYHHSFTDMYEADEWHFRPEFHEKTGELVTTYLILDLSKGTDLTLDFSPKDEGQVFVMNNAGKTIDRYSF